MVLDKLKIWNLIVFLIIIPFSLTSSVMDPARSLRLIILFIFLIIGLSLILYQNSLTNINRTVERNKIFQNPAILFLGLFCFTEIFLLHRSVILSTGAYVLLQDLSLFIFIVLVADIVLESNNSKTLIVQTIVVSSLLLGIIGILQYLNLAFTDIPGFKGWKIFHSTMVNKNIFSISLMLSIPFSLFLIILESALWRTMGIANLFVSLVCIFVSGTRSVWIGIAFMFLSIILLSCIRSKYIKRKQGLFRRNLIGTSIFVFFPTIVFSLFIAQGLNLENDIIGRFGSMIAVEGETIANRILLWQNTMEIIWGNLMVGIGSGNWVYSIAGFGSDQFLSSSGTLLYQRPHNDFLWVIAENGLIVGIFFSMFFVTSFLSGYKTLTHGIINDRERKILIIMFSSLIAFMCVSLFSFPKERVYINVLVGLIVAIILGITTKHNVFLVQTSMLPIKSILVVLLLISVFGSGFFALRFYGEQHIKKMLIARQAGDWESVIFYADKSQEFLCPIDHTSTPVSWYKGIAYFSLEDLNSSMVEFQKAYEINPNNPQVLNNLATIYQLSGNTPMALELYQKAVVLAPHFQDALLNLTTIYCEQRRYSEASKFWRNVIKQNNPRYNFINRRIILGLKKENIL